MRKRLISICAIAILLYGIYGCATTDEETSTVEAESEETENADTVDEETAIAENIPAAETETVEEENMGTESGEAANTEDASDTIYLKPCNTYQDILDNAYTVIANHGADIVVVDEIFETTGIWEAGMGRQPDEALAAIGYTLYDVDGNGTEELIIADTGPERLDNRILLMYSLLGDKPVLVIDGWARNRYYLLNDGTIYHAGSGGAAYSVFATFHMAEDGISLEVIDYYSSGYYGESEWGWFHSTTGETTEDESELIEFENEKVPWEMQNDYMAQVKELDLTFFKEKEHKSAEPIYTIESQLSQDDSYVMQDWQVAYVEYIEDFKWKESAKYSLIYVDEDDIPELVIDTGGEADGCFIVTFHNGVTDILQTLRRGFTYIEKKNLLLNSSGNTGFYFDYIYSIKNGKWVYVTGGENRENHENQMEYYVEYLYEWEGKPVDEEEYKEKIAEVYDIEQEIEPGQYERLDEMLFRLQMGTALSQTHRYELYVEDITRDEAEKRCEEKGGYLATITTEEEYECIKNGIEDSGQTQTAYWVGASDDHPSSYPIYEWHEPN